MDLISRIKPKKPEWPRREFEQTLLSYDMPKCHKCGTLSRITNIEFENNESKRGVLESMAVLLIIVCDDVACESGEFEQTKKLKMYDPEKMRLIPKKK